MVADRLDNENENFHEKVYSTFKEIVNTNSQRIITIDASKSIEEVTECAYRTIKEKLNGLH